MDVNARVFNGSSDYIRIGEDGGSHSDWGTLLVVVLIGASAAGFDCFMGGRTTAGAVTFAFGRDATNIQFWNPSLGTSMTTTISNANGWGIVGMGKTSGTTAPRFHKCFLSGPTWTHQDGSSARPDWGSSETHFVLGAQPSYSAYFDGTMFCAAWWDAVVLSDANFESITGLPAILALDPDGFWVLDQASEATPITAVRGAAQAAISGTSVTSATIPNFAPLTTGKTLYPDADLDAGDWTTTPLWSKVDEVTAGGDVISATAS